jgi:hypothetical protein
VIDRQRIEELRALAAQVDWDAHWEDDKSHHRWQWLHAPGPEEVVALCDLALSMLQQGTESPPRSETGEPVLQPVCHRDGESGKAKP